MSRWEFPAILAEAQPLQGLGTESLDDVWRSGQTLEFQANEEVFSQGDPAERCYVLLEGHVKLLQVNAEGEQFMIGFITPGEIFACVAAFGEDVYPASAIAVQPSRAVGWTCETFRELIARHPGIGRNVMDTLGQRLQNSRERAAEMATKSSEQRIAGALLRLARRRSDRPAKNGELMEPIRVSRQDIASMSGTGLYTVSRTLQTWARRGLVTVARQQVSVTDPDGLQRLFDG